MLNGDKIFMIRNFLYNKALIVISLSFSLLIGQTEVSTSVFWYKDKFDETPNVCRQTNILLTFGGTKGGTNYNY